MISDLGVATSDLGVNKRMFGSQELLSETGGLPRVVMGGLIRGGECKLLILSAWKT